MTSPGTPASVRLMTDADFDPVTAMLARAFDDDPLSVWVFPNGRERARALRRFFGLEARSMFLPAGASYTVDGCSAAALWMPPGASAPGATAALHLIPLILHTRLRTARVLRYLAAVSAKHPKTPHYYLGVLGTDPPLQGKGLGSAVLGPVLERCDAEGIPAYLESSKERNVPFYRRHGFQVTEELSPPGAPTLWLMWRDPVAR